MPDPIIKGDSFITMRDLANGLRRDGKFDTDILDMIAETNPILDDIPTVEANDGSTMVTTLRTELPSAIFRAYYEGTPNSKGARAQIRDTTGQISSKLEVEKELFDKDVNSKAYYADEVNGHLQAMGEAYAEALFYGNMATEARKFNGLDHYFGKIGATGTDEKKPSHYVFNGKIATSPSSDALRSIWLVGWSPRTIRSFYPQGSSGGIRKSGFNSGTATDAKGDEFEVYRQFFYWDVGLSVRDFRFAGRIANMEADKFLVDNAPHQKYIELIRRLVARVRSGDGARQVFYMDRQTWEAVQTWFARATAANAITYGNVEERKPDRMFGIPVRLCDCLNTNEAVVPTEA